MFCWRSGHIRLEGSSPPLDIVALNVASYVGECLLRWCVASCVGALPPALACCLVGALVHCLEVSPYRLCTCMEKIIVCNDIGRFYWQSSGHQ